jgi:putative ABC transport system permease protein
MEQIAQDVRFGFRMLRRNPGFAIVAILTLGLGIGVTTAVFSVVNTVLLRPLPYPDADRIVSFSDGITAGNPEHFKPGIAGADFAEWRARATSFEKMAGYFYGDSNLATDHTRVVSVAGDFWAIAGAHAILGRLFEPEKSQDAIVLSYSTYKRQFQADPSIVGKTVALDGKPMIVAGILQQDFRFLFPQDWWHGGLEPAEPGAFISAPPLVRSKPSRLFVVARLKPLISITTALAELQGIEAAVLKSYPDRWFPGVSRMELPLLQTRLTGTHRRALLILQAAGLFVLLIACANIANLLLARGAARTHEMAIRSAVGANAARILRQFLAEGILLALLGGAAGLLMAKWGIAMLVHFGATAVPRLAETSIDGQVVAFTFGLCLGSGILFGFGPAGGLRVRRFLVASELALAIILLTGAGLMVKSFWKMYANPSGFAPEDTLVMKVALSGPRYANKDRQAAYFGELLSRIESMPGVRAAGIANIQDYLLQSNSPTPPVVDQFRKSLVSPGYFQAIGMRLLKGSWFTGTDPSNVMIINETMARRAFGDKDPLGKQVFLRDPTRVIGVVANLKYAKLDADPGPEIFLPYSKNLGGGNVTMAVAVRMSGDPLGIAPAMRKSIAAIDPAQPVYDVESLEQALVASVSARRFNLFLLGTFAGAALVMALVGVYGVIAYSVTQRTKEIGIRMALGARRSTVVGMVVRQAMAMGLWGIAAGLAGAYGLTRLMGSLLYGVEPDDTATFAAAASALFATVVLASWAPALKAALVNPLVALRHE